MTTSETRSYSLKPLLITQFFGAFNDNAWKMIVMALGFSALAQASGAAPDTLEQQRLTTFVFIVFNIPMVLFSLPAGALADRASKRNIIVFVKVLEVLLMTAGLLALLIAPNLYVLLTVLGLMGAQSALFSPAKYGILPELLPHEKLSAGNGLLELWTMMAIIAGTGVGAMLLPKDAAGNIYMPWVAAVPLVLLAVVGLVASLRIPRVLGAAETAGTAPRGIVATVRVGWQVMRGDRIIWLTVAGMIVYWSIVSLLGQNLIVYTDEITAGNVGLTGIPLAVFGLGVGLGAVAAGRLSSGKVEYGLIPLGAILFSLFTFALSIGRPGFWVTLAFMPFLGAASGLVVVPLNAILQWRTPADRRGAVIALSNVFILLGTAGGSIGAYLLARAGANTAAIFLAGAVAVLIATVWSIYLLPVALLRLVLFLLTHSIYRLKVVGREHVPESGGVLLVANHVSLVDGLLIMACLDRGVRFVISNEVETTWWLRPFLRALDTIALPPASDTRATLRALRDAGDHLDRGDVVCVFPEGQLTRTGSLLPFGKEYERVAKGREAVIVPVYLDRLWGSVFSYAGRRVLWKMPKHLPYPVQVRFGEVMPADTPMPKARRAVHDLSEEAWRDRMAQRPPLHHTLIKALRRRRFAFAFGDEQRPRVSRLAALSRTIALAKALQKDWQDQPRVGILLPPSVAAALVNFAATMAGRTSVNLNYTAGRAGLASAAAQAELRTVVTSRAFLEKANIDLPDNVQPIWIEDVAKRLTFGGRCSALLLALFGSIRRIERACGGKEPGAIDDVVTIIFSSGSTGEPKGVELTHANIDANVEGCIQVFPLQPNDRLLGILPLFHSFGYMTTWMAANHGTGVVFHANPLDAAGIGNLVQQRRLTILIATPTFLQLYLKRATPSQFGSLRFVLTGAEKLPLRLAETFESTFGIRPIEGYGTTECAPVVAVSTLDYRGQGIFQSGSRAGSVGHALPGVALKLVDPDTFEPLPAGDSDEAGLLLVRGPNVMRGYLGKPEQTAEVLRDGWYVTGDMAGIDEDGFVRITDRLSRFSKIGGEMVPHGRVEEALQQAAGADVQVFAVTAVPDEKKGERLAVLHTLDEDQIPSVLEKLAASGLPNLFIPRADQFIKVDELPFLGTGKLDLRRVKQIALGV